MKRLLIMCFVVLVATGSYAQEMVKRDAKTAVITTTQEETISIDQLKMRKQIMERRLSQLQADLDKVNIQIEQLKKIGVE